MNTWDDFVHATPAEIVAWAEDQPWARAMAACQQDVHWHAEGDVWRHTRMVVDQLPLLDDWASLDDTARLKLVFTALFHDAGKPETTIVDPESGRTRSPKHSLVSTAIARHVLRELESPLAFREEVARLVRYHGRPPYMLEKSRPEHETIHLSWMVHNRLLYLFTLADTRGRETTESNRPEENLHLFRVMAEETDCLDRPYAFANDHARFLFFRDELSSLHYVPKEEFRCTVTMMSGLPGAGKDTWLSLHRPDVPVVSLDDLRVELGIEAEDEQGEVIQLARERCREHLRAGRDFAFNATNTMRQTRRRWIDLFADYHAHIELIYLEPTLTRVRQQNRDRAKKVPSSVLEKLIHKLEPPSPVEAHQVVMW